LNRRQVLTNAFWAAAALGISGCATENCPGSGDGLGSTCGQGGSSNDSSGSGSGILLIANGSNLLRFSSASTIEGNIVPAAIVRGGLTRLSGTSLLSYDNALDRLYVPNRGDSSVSLFDQVSQVSENVAPQRWLVGPNSKLNGPIQAVADQDRGLLYVANGDSTVQVFSIAQISQGDLAPVRSIGGAATRFSSISSIALDSSTDRLMVANTGSNSVLFFDSASVLNGSPAPQRELSGGNTRLASPKFLLARSNRLFVAQAGGWLRFEGLAGLAGDIAPAGVVTGLGSPTQLELRSDSDELYVLDGSAVTIYSTASTANGSPLPVRTLSGSNTSISGATGMSISL
jgi:hypothetical protein